MTDAPYPMRPVPRAVLDELPDAVVMVARTGCVTYVNTRAVARLADVRGVRIRPDR